MMDWDEYVACVTASLVLGALIAAMLLHAYTDQPQPPDYTARLDSLAAQIDQMSTAWGCERTSVLPTPDPVTTIEIYVCTEEGQP